MMSYPHNVSVNHPGMCGTSAQTHRSGSRIDAQDGVDSTETDKTDITGAVADDDLTDGPEGTVEKETSPENTGWTIGATDGIWPSMGAASCPDSNVSSSAPDPQSQTAMNTQPLNGGTCEHQKMAQHESLAEAMAQQSHDDPWHGGGVRKHTPPPTLSSLSTAVLSPAVLSPFLLHSRGRIGTDMGGNGSSSNPFTSHYQEQLFHRPNIAAVESILSAACATMGFDIAEMWLRTGPKTHQLINSYLSPPALGTDHDQRYHSELVDVYYGDKSAERTHRLSPALCKRAKEAMDVVWVTAHTEHGADALRCAISDVRTAAAVPVCHPPTKTNMTLIYFSVRRALMQPAAVEFLVHMSLAAAISAVEAFAEEIFLDIPTGHATMSSGEPFAALANVSTCHQMSRSEHVSRNFRPVQRPQMRVSPFGAKLDMRWSDLANVEYLTDGGNNWIHTAVVNGRSVVVKTLKPECQDVALAINEIEGELEIHSKLNHVNIVELIGAGTTSKGNRFVVLERLDGGTLTQVLGYDTRIRDRRRRFWRRKQMSYVDVLTHARALADALAYCQGRAVPGSMCLHRDIKPDNIGFTLDGTLKLLDFGLARIVENASPFSEEVYHMSGETGSLRYMAPEVADSRPYNHKADVYSFGIILWELMSFKKPYDGLNRETFYVRVVKSDERPPIHKKWPKDICNLMEDCWSADMHNRPNFDEIVERLDRMFKAEKGGGRKSKGLASLIDRHSTWF